MGRPAELLPDLFTKAERVIQRNDAAAANAADSQNWRLQERIQDSDLQRDLSWWNVHNAEAKEAGVEHAALTRAQPARQEAVAALKQEFYAAVQAQEEALNAEIERAKSDLSKSTENLQWYENADNVEGLVQQARAEADKAVEEHRRQVAEARMKEWQIREAERQEAERRAREAALLEQQRLEQERQAARAQYLAELAEKDRQRQERAAILAARQAEEQRRWAELKARRAEQARLERQQILEQEARDAEAARLRREEEMKQAALQKLQSVLSGLTGDIKGRAISAQWQAEKLKTQQEYAEQSARDVDGRYRNVLNIKAEMEALRFQMLPAGRAVSLTVAEGSALQLKLRQLAQRYQTALASWERAVRTAQHRISILSDAVASAQESGRQNQYWLERGQERALQAIADIRSRLDPALLNDSRIQAAIQELEARQSEVPQAVAAIQTTLDVKQSAVSSVSLALGGSATSAALGLDPLSDLSGWAAMNGSELTLPTRVIRFEGEVQDSR